MDLTTWFANQLANGYSPDQVNGQRAKLLNQAGASASQFGQQAGYNYGADQIPLQQSINYLQGVAQGKNSVSAEQLRQGLQQQYAQQRSMAASASPQNAAMAGLMAARNMGNAGTALAGQQALAGLQERQNAQQALGQLALGQRQQDLQGFLGSNQNAIGAYGTVAPVNQQAMLDQQSKNAALGGFASVLGAALSDRRAKTDIKPGDAVAGKAVGGLKAHMFRYKTDLAGTPKRLGVMAQDLQKTPGLAHTVIDTPRGKVVHAGQLSTANTAMIAHLAKRVGDLEASKRKDVGQLTAAKRARIPKSEMGLPGRAKKGGGAVTGTFPMPDKRHALAAERLAGRSQAAGNISAAQRARIDAKARRVLAG